MRYPGCSSCGAGSEAIVGDVQNAHLVCTQCGLVVDKAFMPHWEQYSVREHRRVASVYRRSIHFRERITQWIGQAPRVLHYARKRLRAVFQIEYPALAREAKAVRRGSTSRRRVSRPLTKDQIRYLIHKARLSQKQLAEKFVQIRYLLQAGYMRQPQPTREVIAQMEAAYAQIVNVWERTTAYRGARSNIINLNLVMTQLMAKYGGDALYWAHYDDFQSVGKPKWVELYRMLTRICRRVGWRTMPCVCSAVRRRD